MMIYSVITTLPIGENTTVLVDGDAKPFKKGIGILDDNGKPFEVLSVGMSCSGDVDELLSKTSLLVKGRFLSEKLFV